MSTKLLEALKRGDEIQLIVKGRVTGKETSRPVWFVLRNRELFLLPVGGSTTQWYKNSVKNPEVKITIAGQTYAGKAGPIRDKQAISEVVQLFREKYGAGDIKKYYPRTDAATKVKLTHP